MHFKIYRKCKNDLANALELLQSWSKPSISHNSVCEFRNCGKVHRSSGTGYIDDLGQDLVTPVALVLTYVNWGHVMNMW